MQHQSTESPIYFVHAGAKPPFSDQKGASEIGDSVLCATHYNRRVPRNRHTGAQYRKKIDIAPAVPFWNESPFQTFAPKFQPEFVVDGFDELSEMEIRSKNGVSCRRLHCADVCFLIIEM
jgi:hypothetical protein